MAGTGPPVLDVRGFSAGLRGGSGVRLVVSSVSFEIEAGSIVGLFGVSGCGKTTLALGLMGLLSAGRYQVSGSVSLNGREIAGLPERSLQAIRGAGISMIFQDPALALNPVMRAQDQVREPARAHGLQADPVALLRTVGLEEAERIAKSYPHQLSGGERQRVAIAQALVCSPRVVIADEPFTALDASSALALADLLVQLKSATGAAFLVISHSPGVLARIADSVLMMHDGKVVGRGSPAEVFRRMAMPGSGNAG